MGNDKYEVAKTEHLNMISCAQSFIDDAAKLIDEIRLKRLMNLGVLNTEPEAIFDELIDLIVKVSGYSAAMLSFIDNNLVYVKSASNVIKTVVPRPDTLCNIALADADNMLIVEDIWEADDLPHQNMANISCRSYAGKAIKTNDGTPVGVVCIVDPEPRVISNIQMEIVNKAANIIGHLLEERSARLNIA